VEIGAPPLVDEFTHKFTDALIEDVTDDVTDGLWAQVAKPEALVGAGSPWSDSPMPTPQH